MRDRLQRTMIFSVALATMLNVLGVQRAVAGFAYVHQRNPPPYVNAAWSPGDAIPTRWRWLPLADSGLRGAVAIRIDERSELLCIDGVES